MSGTNSKASLLIVCFFNQVKLWCQSPEVWLLQPAASGGQPESLTYHRKVQNRSTTGHGQLQSAFSLTLCVEAIDFDSQACQLRSKGTNMGEQYVRRWRFYEAVMQAILRHINFDDWLMWKGVRSPNIDTLLISDKLFRTDSALAEWPPSRFPAADLSEPKRRQQLRRAPLAAKRTTEL
ncbi:protein pelota homolog [Lates japonicus]|uniref:Protein pelota homolog n=1 Tax=Lates japonicus TaxID=270547 RepID=A0AAD3NLX5_LATJO|nr:protein pelota homolog [Lates japonicus]